MLPGPRCGWWMNGNREVIGTLVTADLGPLTSDLRTCQFTSFSDSRLNVKFGRPSLRLRAEVGGLKSEVRAYSSTLSSSFFLPQSAAAWTKARTTGCGFFSVEESCGWNNVAT